MSLRRDPTGLTPVQAVKRARLLFDLHPTLGVVYKGDKIIARAFACTGQVWFAGRKSTRGCGYNHLQPCPGGPIIYQIVRQTLGAGLLFHCIEASGDSWTEALGKITAQRKAQALRYRKSKP